MLTKIELETVSKVIDQLTYYQILKVSPAATESEIRDAFHREALQFHPDQYFSSDDPELKELAKKIYGRVVEAYRTLSSRQKRTEYDQEINQAYSANPIDDEEDEEDVITSVRRKPDWATGNQQPGNKFYKLAEAAYYSRDYKSALMNIQIALGTDETNAKYKNLKDRIEFELNKSQS